MASKMWASTVWLRLCERYTNNEWENIIRIHESKHALRSDTERKRARRVVMGGGVSRCF